MDLGIAGKSAIVCASSRGLGRACAESLAGAGVVVTINGRDADTLEATRKSIADAGGQVNAVLADVGTKEGQAALLAACPNPDILVNNNGGPPFSDFRNLDRDAMVEGVKQNMVTPIELIQSCIDGMIEREFGRIVNITSMSVKKPISGLDLSSSKKTGESVETLAANRAATIPAKRFGEPDEFGAACAFLCSAHAGYITGQSLLIDGGAYYSAF